MESLLKPTSQVHGKSSSKSRPKKFGPGSRCCCSCANHHGIIRKYGLNMCRRCFRQYAPDIGFRKLD